MQHNYCLPLMADFREYTHYGMQVISSKVAGGLSIYNANRDI